MRLAPLCLKFGFGAYKAKMISVKVFELRAGPRTVERVQLEKTGTLAAQLSTLSAAIGKPIGISSAAFHTVRENAIDKEPLATDVPLDAIGITNDSFLVIWLNNTNMTSQGEPQGGVRESDIASPAFLHVESNAPMSETSSLGMDLVGTRTLADSVEEATASIAPPAAAPPPVLTGTSNTNGPNNEWMPLLLREVENAKQKTAFFWERCTAELTRSNSTLEKEHLLKVLGSVTRLTEQQQVVEAAIALLQEQTGDRARVASVLVSICEVNANILKELAAMRQQERTGVQEDVAAIMQLQGKIQESVRFLLPETPSKASIQSPVVATNYVKEAPRLSASSYTISKEEYALHDSLLQQFFSAVGHVTVTVSELLTRFDNLGDIYAAVSVRYNLQRGRMQEAVQRCLQSHLPSLAPATPVVCYLHNGREVEYVESIILHSLGLNLRPPHLWIEVALPPGVENCCSKYYYSSLVGLSQRERPRCLQSVHSDVCRFSELSSVCPRLGLRNPQWMEHDNHTHARLRRSKLAAALLFRRPDLVGNMDAVLGSYTGREETLWKVLTAGAGS
ncbi:hypothetical protein TRSC58_03019 [Trypanosoma rangeli SC58]|uniref:Ubiquitin-like domain-containing protein n=1 Tax=Trypanosoma rangeli SC58 TaxID=429131 RepID=A0A061J2Y7_TRYRA|nr:hypothetical protein TRSC58_03019 [Trypanosoma rangeli SC58]